MPYGSWLVPISPDYYSHNGIRDSFDSDRSPPAQSHPTPAEKALVLDLLFRGIDGNDVSKANDELNRVAQITKQTLQFYRSPKDAASIDVSESIDITIKSFLPLAKAKGAIISTEYKTNTKILAFDGQLRQVFTNLLTNALEAGATVIKIRVSAFRKKSGVPCDGVRVIFADNGAGIPVDVVKGLFEPFFTTKEDKGTGLGLWITKNIIQKHCGNIKVLSCTKSGRCGTSFSIFLPVRWVKDDSGLPNGDCCRP
jgi:signal transduction histidine kinase